MKIPIALDGSDIADTAVSAIGAWSCSSPIDRPSTVRVEFSEQTAKTIVETARTLGVDAIAMATHGRTGLLHVLMGSVAEEVMRQSPMPVVLVGPQVHTKVDP